jgi:dihydroorotase
MKKTEHLLTCLIEECAEIQKSAAKALRFGLDDHAPNSDSTNADDISTEIYDLIAVIEMLKEENIIPNINTEESKSLINIKKEKVKKYMNYAKERGILL